MITRHTFIMIILYNTSVHIMKLNRDGMAYKCHYSNRNLLMESLLANLWVNNIGNSQTKLFSLLTFLQPHYACVIAVLSTGGEKMTLRILGTVSVNY
jgi:hypothetical protein